MAAPETGSTHVGSATTARPGAAKSFLSVRDEERWLMSRRTKVHLDVAFKASATSRRNERFSRGAPMDLCDPMRYEGPYGT